MINETMSVLMDHRSVREYSDRPVEEETVNAILDAAQMAPTSSYLQAYSIIRVRDPGNRQVLKEASGGQDWLVRAPLVLLFCADLYRISRTVTIKDANILHNAELYTVAVADTALCAQKALIAAQSMGLGGVIVGGIRNDPDRIAETFLLPELVFPVFALCLGYPAAQPEQRPRMPRSFVMAVDRYPAIPAESELSEYDEQVRQWFKNATNGRSDRSWRDRAGFAIESKPRYDVERFLKRAQFITKDSPSAKE